MVDIRSVDKLFQNSVKAIKAFSPSEAYRQGFQLFKEKNFSASIEIVSRHLCDHDSHADKFMAYRLWIECLAEMHDHKSLEMVGNHLVNLVDHNEQDFASYVALGGLAFLEADSFGRSRLMARCVIGRENPYVHELVQRLRLRVGQGGREPYLLRSQVPFIDYFQWDLMVYCVDLWVEGSDKIKQKANDIVTKEFKDHIRLKLAKYHEYIENGLFAAANLVADMLHQTYPKQDNFLLLKSFASYEDGDYPTARKGLSEYVRRNPTADVEVLGLLGMCHGKIGDGENASKILRDAIEIGSIEGISISDMAIELGNITDELSLSQVGNQNEDPQQDGSVQNWMIKLSQSRYFQLMNSSPDVVDRLLLPLGAVPKEGDFVFFAAGEKVETEYFWNVVAVYVVDSKPIRHSRHEYLSVVKLISRLPITVPIDVSVREDHLEELSKDDLEELGWSYDRKAVKKIAKKFGLKIPQNYANLPKGYPFRYGVYQLDVGALELIEKAIENQSQNLIDRRIKHSIRRPTA